MTYQTMLPRVIAPAEPPKPSQPSPATKGRNATTASALAGGGSAPSLSASIVEQRATHHPIETPSNKRSSTHAGRATVARRQRQHSTTASGMGGSRPVLLRSASVEQRAAHQIETPSNERSGC
mmetsp:Transcript_32426/g.69053  ORF Transcript_32426/g.69053 Transcript_32426/m.69053 type:complete len:123 (+) Transcript_32426:160-528(+)